MEGENKPPGGMRKHEKKGRRYALYEWMWCDGELRCDGVVTAGDPVYGLVIPLRLLLAACVCYPPVAQTRFRSDSGLGGGN